MSRDEFIAGYCERSAIAWAELEPHMIPLQCACGEEGCKGWAMVPNNALSIRVHKELYSPAGRSGG